MEKLITPRSVTHFSRRRFLLAGAAVGVLFNLLLELPRVRRWLYGLEQTAEPT